jgi:hypothetical protein
MAVRIESTHPYATHVGVRLIAASPHRAVVEQPGLTVLDNHVGIRHASALYAAAWAASHALVSAALADGLDALAEPRLSDSEIRYEQVPRGPITTVAQPTSGDWDALEREDAELRATAISIDEHGKTVVALDTTWRVGPTVRR